MQRISIKTIALISLIIHLVVAIGSLGFHHPDEQYYAIDFALLKMNFFNPNDFTWEYNSQIRPWFLPSIFYGVINTLKSIGVDNPFTAAMIIRIISALLSWFTSYRFALYAKKFFFNKNIYKYYFSTIQLFCFSIYMGVRTSADNWMTAFILLAISSTHLGLTGFLFGLAFSIKHQAGLIALSYGLWLLFIKKTPFKDWLGFSSLIFLGVLVGVAADTWGYGQFTLTSINYLKVNILQDKISTFGTHPWWYYFKLITIKLNPLWSLPLILLTALHIKNYSKSFLTWTFIPYFIFHLMIGHKELRFLLPLLPLSILMAFMIIEKWPHIKIRNYLRFSFLINSLFLIFFSLKPAYTPLTFYKKIYSLSEKSLNGLDLSVIKDRKGRYPEFELKYYLPRTGLRIKRIQNVEDIKTQYLLTTKYSDFLSIDKSQCTDIFSSYPKWTFNYNFFGWLNRSNIWILYKCR